MQIMKNMWINNALISHNDIDYFAKNEKPLWLINPNLSEFIQGNTLRFFL